MTSDAHAVPEPHDEFPDLLAGEPVDPEHDLDLDSFEDEPDEDEVDR